MDMEFLIILVVIMAVVFVNDMILNYKEKDHEAIQTGRYYTLVALIVVIGLIIHSEIRDIRKIDIDQTCKSTYNIY